MAQHFHAIVWIDHHEARIFHFNATDVERDIVRPHDPNVHVHHKANTVGSGHAPIDHDFFRRVTDAIAKAGAVMIVGPSTAKTELATFIAEQNSALSARVATVEAVDHPTDNELVAQARRFFRANDRMRQIV